MPERWVKFVFEAVTGSAASGARGVAALNHEIRNDAVKCKSIIVAALSEVQKVGNGDRGFTGVESAFDDALTGLDFDGDIADRIGFRGVESAEADAANQASE